MNFNELTISFKNAIKCAYTSKNVKPWQLWEKVDTEKPYASSYTLLKKFGLSITQEMLQLKKHVKIYLVHCFYMSSCMIMMILW